MKQTMINKYSNKHNKVKNPTWQEADQLAIYKRSREVELGVSENNISQRSEQDLNPRPTDFTKEACWSAQLFSLSPYGKKKTRQELQLNNRIHYIAPAMLFYLTIRLWARDFYEVIVDEAEGRINYRLIEIESE